MNSLPYLRIILVLAFMPVAFLHAQNKNFAKLDSPIHAQAYARNIWDLHHIDGRIYLGYGNSSNSGPASNAGPIEVWCYDEAKKLFVREALIQSEQINQYREIHGELFIPNHDPHGNIPLGYLRRHSRKAPSGEIEYYWKSHKINIRGHHVYDMIEHGPHWFAALGTSANMLGRARAGAKKWKALKLSGLRPALSRLIEEHHGKAGMIGRMHELFVLNQELYSIKSYHSADWPLLFKKRGDSFQAINHIPNSRFFSSLKLRSPTNLGPRGYRLVRTQAVKEGLAYIAVQSVNDHQWNPLSVHYMKQIEDPFEIPLQEGYFPYDLCVWQDQLLVVVARKISKQSYNVKILAIPTPVSKSATASCLWSATLPSFARSMAVSSEALYLGLGSDHHEINKSAGNIYRVELSKLSKKKQ